MGMMSTAVRGQVEVSRTSQLKPWKLYEKLKSIAKLLFSKPPFLRCLGCGLQWNMVGTFFYSCDESGRSESHVFGRLGSLRIFVYFSGGGAYILLVLLLVLKDKE